MNFKVGDKVRVGEEKYFVTPLGLTGKEGIVIGFSSFPTKSPILVAFCKEEKNGWPFAEDELELIK
jgi:hypothetical protein